MAYISKWKGTEIDDSIQKVVDNSDTWDSKQEKLKGKQGQVVGFDALGNAVAQDLGDGDAVTSFNGRKGDVLPQTGDYTAAMVGAKPAEWMPTPADIGALPDDVNIPTKTSELENDSGFITASDIGDIDIGDLENVVHVDGGATLEIPVSIGNAPHVITVTEESGDGSGGGGGGGNVDLSNLITLTGGGNVNLVGDFGDAPYVIEITESTEDDGSGSSGASVASDVSYDNTDTGMDATNVQEAIDELFQSVSEGKSLIASAVTDKGVETAADASFETIAENISQISSGPSGDFYNIEVTASPSNLGTVSGGGKVSNNVEITVKAQPTGTNSFHYWEEDGNQVSTESNYSFIVTQDRNLSAKFETYAREPVWALSSLEYNNTTGYWATIAYGNNKYVAVSNNGYIGYSENAIDWNITDKQITFPPSKIAYGNGIFVAVPYSYNYSTAAYSNDGITWLSSDALPFKASFTDVVHGLNKFWVGGSAYPEYTSNGKTWSQSSTGMPITPKKIAYGNNRLVGIANQNTKAIYSTNGTSWSESSSINSAYWSDIAYGNNRFVAISRANGNGMYSTNGVNWTNTIIPNGGGDMLEFGNGIFILKTSGNYESMYSKNGENWTYCNITGTSHTWVDMTFGNNKFVTIAQDGTVAYTT